MSNRHPVNVPAAPPLQTMRPLPLSPSVVALNQADTVMPLLPCATRLSSEAPLPQFTRSSTPSNVSPAPIFAAGSHVGVAGLTARLPRLLLPDASAVVLPTAS